MPRLTDQGLQKINDLAQHYGVSAGRKTAMRNAGTTAPAGRGYSDAFNDWLAYNRFDLKQTQRASCLR